jgi:hypothetical protein
MAAAILAVTDAHRPWLTHVDTAMAEDEDGSKLQDAFLGSSGQF